MDLNNLTIFLQKHLLLVSSFGLVFLTIIMHEIRAKSRQALAITPQELVMAMNEDNPIIIEIRDLEAYKKAHIMGAKHLSPQDLKPETFDSSKKNKLVLVCEQGVHSRNFANKLKDNGWENVVVLAGGIQAWREAGLPLEKK